MVRFVKSRLPVLVAFLLMVFPSLPVVAGGVPPVPSIYSLRGWQPVTDRNVIVSFDDYEFKHHMVELPTPYPPCGEVQVKGREVWLLTPEANPSLYIIELEPNAYRERGTTDWDGAMGKTSGWIKDYQN